MQRRQKVLIYHLGSLGDTIVAVPSLRLLSNNFPDAEIVLLYERRSGVVAPPEVIADTLVDRYISYSREDGESAPAIFRSLLSRIRRERFDAVAYLVFSERSRVSVLRDKAFFRLSGAERLIGFRAYSSADLYPKDPLGRPAPVTGEAQRKFERLVGEGLHPRGDEFNIPWIDSCEENLGMAQGWISQNHVHRPLVAIAPGCKTLANQWPVGRVAELISVVQRTHGGTSVIVGGPAEEEAGLELAGKLPNVINAAGNFNVPEMAALLRVCDAYVGLDTGTTHLAAAVGLPVVALYGQRNNPGQWFPAGVSNIVQSPPVECAGCRAEICPLGSHPCMSNIDIPSVVDALNAILAHDRECQRGVEI